MMKRTCNQSLRILLIDDNTLTSFLVLRFLGYLGHQLTFFDTPQHLEELEQKFHLVLINLACSFHEAWIKKCIQCINKNVPVLSYSPDFLIHDFNQAGRNPISKLVNDNWMLNSRLFQFIKEYEC